jgi:hypothetical protein
MLEKIREAKRSLHLVEMYMPKYAMLLKRDAHQFRIEIVKATVGAAIGGAAGLMFVCFLSIAVVVSAWSGSHRVTVVWAVCAAWGLLSTAGGVLLRATLSGPAPFLLVSRQAQADYSNLLIVLKQGTDA